jgi:hypothetical protein
VIDSSQAVAGLDGFVSGLAGQGIETVRRESLVVYRLEPVTGALAGECVETGVVVDELSGWPHTPPHWIHVPIALKIPGGQGGSVAGWSRYSRPHPGRLDAAPSPAKVWIAHVREFLGHAA